MRRNRIVALPVLVVLAATVSAQRDDRAAMLAGIEAKRESYASVAKQIWAFAEVGYQEQKSSALLQHSCVRPGSR